MKDLDLLHYFLSLEFSQKSGEIFLSQGKYAVSVLRSFDMMNYKSMSIQMISNPKNLRDQATSSDPKVPTLHRQIIDLSRTYENGHLLCGKCSQPVHM
jgi:hypothetical protein